MNGLQIRQAKVADAENFLNLWDALDSETEFMLFEPGERKVSVEDQRSRLANAAAGADVHIIALEDAEKKLLAGFCAGRRSSNLRDKHVLETVIGIRQKYTGRGWGYKLFEELETWAVSKGVKRLELSVMANNQCAIALYEKFGFEIEGRRRNAVLLKAGYIDEYIMAKLL